MHARKTTLQACKRFAASILLAPLLLAGSALLPLSLAAPALRPVSLAAPGPGADTQPYRPYPGSGGQLTEQGITTPYRGDPETLPQSVRGVDEDDADPVGSDTRVTILAVLGLVMLSIAFYYLRRTDPISN